MSEFLKPQSPLQHRDGAYIYPLTTTDQVILEDNTRLNATLDKVAYMGEKNQGAATEIINADTLGGRLPSYYAKATKLTPRNLLDNSDFTNPVNQRGQTSFKGDNYWIDRWKGASSGSSAILESGIGLTFTATGARNLMIQNFPDGTFTGKTLTAACCDTNGNILVGSGVFPEVGSTTTAAYNAVTGIQLLFEARNGNHGLRIGLNSTVSEDVTIVWAALYEGEYIAETLPEYQPKGYSAELAECQRYYLQFGQVNAFGFISSSAKSYYMTIQTPVPMRAIPTKVTMSGYVARIATGYSVRTSGNFTAPESLSIWKTSPYLQGQITVIDTIATAVDTNNSNMTFMIRDLTLSADL